MKRIISMIARLGVMALILVPAVPAAANHGTPTQASASVTVFRGLATLADDTGNGFFFPISDACGGICPGGSGTFSLQIPSSGNAAVGVVATVNRVTPTASDVAIFSVVSQVSGTVTPGTAGLGAWCGYSSGYDGQGTATPTRIAPGAVPALPAVTLSRIGWIQSAATLIQSNGRASSAGGLQGTIHSLSSAIPIDAEPGSCQDGMQKTFDVVGVSVTLLTD